MLEFQRSLHLQALGTGRVVHVPIWCLRWVQSGVHSQMTFTSGNHKDHSVYELVHDMVSKRRRPEDVEPLDVVVDEGKMYIVRGSRRGVALSSLQGIWRHTTVHAKCRLYRPDDPKLSGRFSAKDTSGSLKDGVGIQLNGHQREAWHMGKPLFRCAEEWCDSMATTAEGATRQPQISESVSDRRFGLEIGMLVLIKSSNANAKGDCFAEVQRFSQTEQSVKLGCIAQSGSNKLPSEWFPLDCLLLPDYSELQEGLQLQVKDKVTVSDKKQFYGKVLQVSKEKKHSRAPVLVHYRGYTSDSTEWVGADRLSTKFMKFVPPKPEACLDQPSDSSVQWRPKAAATVVSDVRVEDGPVLPIPPATAAPKSPTPIADLGTLVCISSDGKQRSGVVSEISEAEQKVKVSYKGVWVASKRADEWLPFDSLQIPEYSSIEKALPVQVLEESGSNQWHCSVLQVSQSKKRANAPVQVHYIGYSSEFDEWVGADRLRSKLLKFCPFSVSTSGAECPRQSAAASVHDPLDRVGADLCGSLVYATTAKGLEPGEIVEVSQDNARAAMPIKVRLKAGGARWFSLDSLQIPDYSNIQEGLSASVLHGEAGSKHFVCTVLQVSRSKDRQLEPVLVHYNGYTSDDDEWVGADRFRSKQLKFLDLPKLKLLARTRQTLPQEMEDCAPVTTESPLPWNEPDRTDADADAFDLAIKAVQAALHSQEAIDKRQADLESTLARIQTEELRLLLDQHGWTGTAFSQRLDLQCLLDQLKSSSDVCEDSCREGDENDELPAQHSDDSMFTSSASKRELQREMETQSDHVASLNELMGTLVLGTFRSTSETNQRQGGGEVIVHDGPHFLHGCKVHIPPGKNRGATWDNDRCYARILFGRSVEGSSGKPCNGCDALDMERTELFGQIVHAEEFGVQRQKVSFHPINGKFPSIRVPWSSAVQLPSNEDLHVVEVVDWTSESAPRGRYLESLNMSSRHSDISILEAVQISLNFCDWTRGDVRQRFGKALDFRAPATGRTDLRDSTLTVGIQQSNLPTSLLMSCTDDGFCFHILDVNAYLDTLCMQKVEELVRRRSVGLWCFDHEDRPLDASLPLFPPDVEDALAFKAGNERFAMTLSFHVEEGQFNLTNVEIAETIVKCDCLLSPERAGFMLRNSMAEGQITSLLRRLVGYMSKFNGSEVGNGSVTFLEQCDLRFAQTGDLCYVNNFLQSCMHIVNRCFALRLSEVPWTRILNATPDVDGANHISNVIVSRSHCQPDPSTRKVIERLLRFKLADQNEHILSKDIFQALVGILQQPGLSHLQTHSLQCSFIRRLRAALPLAFYEVASPKQRESLEGADVYLQHEPYFHLASPLQRYIDILGMRALKSQLGWTPSCDHMFLSLGELQEAVGRTNARLEFENFGQYIFRTISRMRQLSSSGQRICDALIGAVGPTYINVLVPSAAAHVLELKVPVSALCSSSCMSEYDASTQSIKLTMSSGYDDVDSINIASWSACRMTCVISRNFAQPIPHHANPNSIVVAELQLNGRKVHTFAVGQRMFPESFSSWPDLSDWSMLDRRIETYAQVWSRIRSCQVHAAAVSSDAYTPKSDVNQLKWLQTKDTWHLECEVDVQLSEYQWLQVGDLAVLSSGSGDSIVVLHGIINHAKAEKSLCGQQENGCKWQKFSVSIELSEVSQHARSYQEALWNSSTKCSLYFILVPSNEKKSIQLLRDMPKSPPLNGMRLTLPRSSQEMKREVEMRPLATLEQVSQVMRKSAARVEHAGLNEKQQLAVQRGLQKPFSMVQGPPGTGKTSFLVQFVVSAMSAPRERWQSGRILVCAPSNHAADQILERLISETDIPTYYITRIYSRFIERTNGSLYKGGSWRVERGFEIQPHLEEHALHWKVNEKPHVKHSYSCSRKAFDQAYEAAELRVLQDSRIVITTCANAYLHTALMQGEPPHVERPVKFDTIIIDEAAQASEPDVVLPSTCAACRVVVVGDHKQLGPVVPERNLCSPYVNALEMPFLERMMKNPRRLLSSTMLNLQYRMHPSIRSFPSSQFYESMLEDSVSIPHRPELSCIWPDPNQHRRFIDCRTRQSLGLSPEFNHGCEAALMESRASLKNAGEAEVAVAACVALLKGKCKAREIAIITPYKAQQHEIRSRLQREIGSNSGGILVGTVHALQGCERECIIISFVRSFDEEGEDIASFDAAGDSQALQELRQQNLGILKNYKLLNVAITRAKYGLVGIGNADVLSNGPKDLRDFMHSLSSSRCMLDRRVTVCLESAMAQLLDLDLQETVDAVTAFLQTRAVFETHTAAKRFFSLHSYPILAICGFLGGLLPLGVYLGTSKSTDAKLPPAMVCLFALVGGVDFFCTDQFQPSMPHMAEEFQISKSSMSLSIQAHQVCVDSPPYTLCCASAPSYEVFILGRILQGIGSSSLAIILAILRDCYEKEEERLKVAGLLFASMLLGPLIAPPIGGFLAARFGWRSSFWLLTGVSGSVVLSSCFMVRETAPAAPTSSYLAAAWRTLAHRRRFLLLLVMAFLKSTFSILDNNNAFMLETFHGLPIEQASFLVSLLAFSGVLGVITSSLLGRKPLEVMKLAFPFVLIAAFGDLLVGLFYSKSLTLYLVCICFQHFVIMLPNVAANVEFLQDLEDIAGMASCVQAAGTFSLASLLSLPALLAEKYGAGSMLCVLASIIFMSLLSMNELFRMSQDSDSMSKRSDSQSTTAPEGDARGLVPAES
eukprot:symbB.v1.2.030092.t2/scaffold3348.1/size58710/2